MDPKSPKRIASASPAYPVSLQQPLHAFPLHAPDQKILSRSRFIHREFGRRGSRAGGCKILFVSQCHSEPQTVANERPRRS